MFYKLLIFILIIISESYCDSSQLIQNLDLNSSELNDSYNTNTNTNNTNETNSDLLENNGTTNDMTINKTAIDPLLINDDLPSVPTPSPPNEMLSFEEWRKKIAEKSINLEPPSPKITSQLTQQSQQSVPPVVQSTVTTKQKPITKRARNFASYECGAKVVDSNPESESVQRILNEQTDEYMLNPCKANIWFVIELCETIQPKTIEIANFELYSSVPKEFSIEATDHYPTRDWSQLGTFNASDERSVQRFQLQNNGFVKFVRIELLSHYGFEHFCPLSVVRVFGTSLFEEVERMDNMDTNQQIPDEDESTLNEELVGESDSTQNLFGTARDAVFNIVRKAAQALNGNNNEVLEKSLNANDSSTMKSLTHLELAAIQLFPKVDKYIHNCNKTSCNLTNCCYLKSLFGQPLYDLLIDHSFNCYVSNSSTNRTQIECSSQTKNNTNQSIKIESSIESHDFDIISPTKPILKEFESKSVEINDNISVNSVSVLSDFGSGVTQTSSETSSTSVESAVLLTIVSDSISSSDKNEELSPVSVISQNEVSNESENSVLNNEELNKNITSNETIVKSTQNSGQPQNGGSNGYISSGSAIGQSKESVVIRLTNRIKALEVNLSLSSQYLEELSLRYRKQMEEMQRAFNITISKLNDTNIRATERDLKQQESIALLESKLNALNTQMSVLLAERESLNWHYIEIHIALMMIEVIVVIIVLLICVNRLNHRINFLQINDSLKEIELKAQNSVSPQKRSHPNSIPYHLPPKTLKIEGEDMTLDSNSINKVINNQRKIRKKKKKLNAMNGNQLSNSLESDAFVLTQNKANQLTEASNASLISKSQSTPVLAIRSQNQLNGKLLGLSDNSCHSSTSGVSSNSGLSNVFTNKKQNTEIKANKKSLNDKQNRKYSSDNKSNSLTHSLKKLLKFERK